MSTSETIVVTGATGQLGRLVIAALLKTTPAAQIVAAVRTPAKANDLAALGVEVREADYGKPETLATAFAGATKVLLISSNNMGGRVAEHTAAIDAAKAAGAKLLAYTSVLRCDTTHLPVAPEHLETEKYLVASGLPYTLLRNGWYLENRTAGLGAAVVHGVLLGSAGEGHFAAAARQDYAEAAAVVLTTPGHDNKTYELAGDTAYTLTQLAAETAKQSGKPVVYKDVPEQEFAAALAGFGLPAELAEMLALCDTLAAKGELDSDDKTLSRLIGHPTTTMAAAVAAALGKKVLP